MTDSLILRTGARVLIPLLLVFSVFLLLRGHNHPGGGFVGGLVAGCAFALQAMAEGVPRARRALSVDPKALAGLGVLLSIASALVGPLSGKPFLAGRWIHLDVPLLGGMDLGTPLLFDFGVYLTVWGVVLVALFLIQEEA